MTQSVFRLRQASQGAESPLTESESGESKPFRSPEYESRCMLPWRLGGKRLGFGAMAMGAVRGTAQGADMAKVKGRAQAHWPELASPRLETGCSSFGRASEDVTRRTVPCQPPQQKQARAAGNLVSLPLTRTVQRTTHRGRSCFPQSSVSVLETRLQSFPLSSSSPAEVAGGCVGVCVCVLDAAPWTDRPQIEQPLNGRKDDRVHQCHARHEMPF